MYMVAERRQENNQNARTCFELEEDYSKPVKVGVFWRTNYI